MRWEIDKYIDFSFFGQFNGWYHITVCGNNDSKVTVMLESVVHYSLNIFSEIPFYELSLYIRYLQMFSFDLNTHEISLF